MIDASSTATLYARPTAFIDAPFGFDGQFARLAGGLQFFAAWEIIATDGGVMVNDANVIATDVAASNGVIHAIDAVLLPPDVDVSSL